MVKHSLYITTYDRGTYSTTGKIKPFHWAFFIHTRTENQQIWGIMHQLRGMPGSFYYPGPEVVDLANSGSPKEQLEIGNVDDDKLQRVHEILEKLSIDKVESSGWNCQNWTLDGLDKLRDEGMVYDYMTKDAVKNWLKEY